MKMQLLAFFLLLLSQLTSCMYTQPHFYGNPEQIWTKVFHEFKAQNKIQGFYNPRQGESNKITLDQMLWANIWHPNNHENYQNEKTSVEGVKTQFLTHFAGLTNMEYKQLYAYSNNLPKEPVVGLNVRTVGIIKVTKYCEETQQNNYSYYLMEIYVSYDTGWWEEFRDREVNLNEVIASIGWKKFRNTEIVFAQKEDKLNFVSINGKIDPEIYYFNEHKTLKIAPQDEDFFEGVSVTTAEDYFNLPVDNNRHRNITVQKYVSTIVMVFFVLTMIRMIRK